MEDEDVEGKNEVKIPFDRANLQLMLVSAVILLLGGLAVLDALSSGILFGTPHKG